MLRRNAFTLVELLVVMAIIILLVAIVAPSFQPVIEMARQSKCRGNLNKIIKDCRAYALAQNDFFPNAYPTVTASIIGGPERFKDLNATAVNAAAPAKCGMTRSMFLLVRVQKISVASFICPSTEDVAYTTVDLGTTATGEYDFKSYKNISYSYQYQKDKSDGMYFPVTTASDAGLAVLADKNPALGPDAWTVGSDTLGWTPSVPLNGAAKQYGLDKTVRNADGTISGNSYNHDQTGQVVAYADSHVTFQATPNAGARQWRWTDPTDNTVKPAGDNIWTAGAALDGAPVLTLTATPSKQTDSMLTN